MIYLKQFITMKRVLGFFVLASMLFFSGCEEDDSDVNVDDRTDFVGTWTCTETPTKSTDNTYTVSITKDTEVSNRVILSNFFQLGQDVTPYGVVIGSSITVPSQTFDTWTVSGSGVITGGNKIVWSLYKANQYSYTAVFNKQ